MLKLVELDFAARLEIGGVDAFDDGADDAEVVRTRGDDKGVAAVVHRDGKGIGGRARGAAAAGTIYALFDQRFDERGDALGIRMFEDEHFEDPTGGAGFHIDLGKDAFD